MNYQIHIVPSAQKGFARLSHSIQERIKEKILHLKANPRPWGTKRLRNSEYYRIRVGSYRVIYSIHDNERLVRILDIAHRKDVYK